MKLIKNLKFQFKLKWGWLVGLLLVLAIVGLVIFFALKPKPEEPERKNVPEKDKKELYERRQKWLETLKDYPEYYEAFLDLGNIEARLGRFNTALDYYNKAYGVVPSSSIPLLNSAEVYLDMKDYDHAEESLIKAIEVVPDYAFGYAKLADFYDKYRNDVDKAIATYQQGINNVEIKNNLLAELANYQANRGRTADAIVTYQEFLKLEPDNAAAKKVIEELQQKLKQS